MAIQACAGGGIGERKRKGRVQLDFLRSPKKESEENLLAACLPHTIFL